MTAARANKPDMSEPFSGAVWGRLVLTEEQNYFVLRVDQMSIRLQLCCRGNAIGAPLIAVLLLFMSPILWAHENFSVALPVASRTGSGRAVVVLPESSREHPNLSAEEPAPVDPGSASESRLLEPGYWIVSSWKSPQEFGDSPLRFCAEVTRHDGCSTRQCSSLEELNHSLVPGVPVCIVVHGSFMDSPSILPDSFRTWQWLKAGSCGIPFQMIYFSWPSDRSITPLPSIDIAILGSRASRNGFYLASLIQQLPAECPVCLVGHSHGTRVISSALHLLGGGVVEGHRHCSPGCNGHQIRVVFIASAIDHDWFNPGERFDRSLCCVECMINLQNGKDPALIIYPLRRIGSSRALGAAGFTSKDRRELGSRSTRIRDWDVSRTIGHDHLWPTYIARPWLASSLKNYLYFADR